MTTPYVTILADPPWAYTDALRMRDGVKRSSQDQYPTLDVQEICDLYTPSQFAPKQGYTPGQLATWPIADIAFLFLWTTAPLLLEAAPQRVCSAWGFTPRQIVPWIKGRIAYVPPRDGCHDLPNPQLILNIGMGHLTRGVAEYLLIATRGPYTSLVQSHSQPGLILAEEDAVMLAPRTRHSTKPDDQYTLIERVCPGPYLELFARQCRDGWTSWGLDVAPPPAAAVPLEEPITWS